ncbi:MAG: DUF2070 family protein [Pyrodictiaceae archaeon]
MSKEELEFKAHSYYGLLFALPSSKMLATLLALLAFLDATILALNTAKLWRSMGQFVAVILSQVLLIGMSYVFSINMRTLKRILSLAVTAALLNLIGLLAALVVNRSSYGGITTGLLGSTIGFASLLSLLIYGLNGVPQSIMVLLVPAMLAAIYEPSLMTLLAPAIAYIVLTRLLAYEEIKASRAFAYAIMSDDYRLLENYGSEKDVEIRLYALKTRSECIVLVAPHIHFGPLRGAGSSILPYLVKEITARGGRAKTIILHTTVTHHDNVSSREEAEKIAKLIAEEARWLCNSFPERVSSLGKIFARKSGSFRYVIIPTIIPIVVIDRPKLGIDDFKVNTRTFTTIDAHNEELEEPIRSDEVKELERKLYKEIAEAWRKNDNCLGRIGFHETTVNAVLAEKAGLCKNWLQVLIIETGCHEEITRLALVVVPSNNAVKGVEETIEKVLSRENTITRIITIDDHYCAGLKPKKATYKFKLDEDGELLRVIEESYREALKRRNSLEQVLEEVMLVRARVWSEFFDKLQEYSRYASYLLVATLALTAYSILLPLIVTLL